VRYAGLSNQRADGVWASESKRGVEIEVFRNKKKTCLNQRAPGDDDGTSAQAEGLK
jgi:hypothetical protein